MGDLYVNWPEYHQKIERLAVKIYQSQWSFNQIVCLSRGGLRVGDILSRIYGKPLAILATSAYGGAGGQVRGEIKIAGSLTMTADILGSQVLLVDDLVDSGMSLQVSVEWLRKRYSTEIEEIRTGVLWYKSTSLITPDYYVDYLEDHPWIHQPFEEYEQIKIDELAAKF